MKNFQFYDYERMLQKAINYSMMKTRSGDLKCERTANMEDVAQTVPKSAASSYQVGMLEIITMGRIQPRELKRIVSWGSLSDRSRSSLALRAT